MLFKANRYSVYVQNEKKSLPLFIYLECQYAASMIVKLLYLEYKEAKGEKDKFEVSDN